MSKDCLNPGIFDFGKNIIHLSLGYLSLILDFKVIKSHPCVIGNVLQEIIYKASGVSRLYQAFMFLEGTLGTFQPAPRDQ